MAELSCLPRPTFHWIDLGCDANPDLLHCDKNLMLVPPCWSDPHARSHSSRVNLANNMAPNSLLAGTWDTHLHLLDPERFPFKADRKYTPSPALVSDLLARTQASNFLVVQATVEDGRTGILTLLRELQEQLPSPHKCFVAIAYDPDEHLTNDDLLRLHMAGVRGFRYHITFAGQDVEETVGVVRRLLHSDQAVFARKYG